MGRPFGSYFFWQKDPSLGRLSLNESRTPTPTLDDKTARPVTNIKLVWQVTSDEEGSPHQAATLREERTNGDPGILSPSRGPYGLDDLQEFFWVEDSLRRTDRQLDRCSSRLDEMHDSAALIRRDLESLQADLASLGKRKRAQPRLEVENLRTQRREPAGLPPLQLPPPDTPLPAVPQRAEPELVEPPTRTTQSGNASPAATTSWLAPESPAESPSTPETPSSVALSSPASTVSSVESFEQASRAEAADKRSSAPPESIASPKPSSAQITQAVIKPAEKVSSAPPRATASPTGSPAQKASLSPTLTPAAPKPLSAQPGRVQQRFPTQTRSQAEAALKRSSLLPSIRSRKVQERIQFWSKMEQT